MVQVAEKLGVSQTMISRIEAGTRDVTETELVKFSDIYGVSPSQLREAAVIRPISETDLDRIGEVIEFVEVAISSADHRPNPRMVREAIIAIFRQENELARKTAVEFDPNRYSELVSILLRHT